jgi:hypothetical protein
VIQLKSSTREKREPHCFGAEINIPNYDGRMAAKLWGDPKNPPLVAMHGT